MIGRLRPRMWRWWRELDRDGKPPTNVRVLAGDDTVVPVSCVWDGHIDGVDHWLILLPDTVGEVAGLFVDELPPRTAITLTRR